MNRSFLAVLLVLGLFLAACGDTAAPEDEAQPTPQTLEPLEFDLDDSELSVQAPGQRVVLNGLAGQQFNIGVTLPPQDGRPERTVVARHFNNFLRIDSVLANDPNLDQFNADSTWNFVAPLATDDASCFSIEASNVPGSFVRHTGARVRIDPNDGSDLFKADATWCSTLSLDGATDAGDRAIFSYESFNFPGYFMRRFNNEVWISNPAGSLPTDNPANFAADASWTFFVP